MENDQEIYENIMYDGKLLSRWLKVSSALSSLMSRIEHRRKNLSIWAKMI